jgi:hypothetical protein
VADIGLHATEALVLTVGLAEAIRGPLGRARPRESPDDSFHFEFGVGSPILARDRTSMHAAGAWTTALVGELKLREPDAVKYVAPPLFVAATIPGLTRLYLNQHWASDVAAGTLMDALLGTKVVSYAHSHDRNFVDRLLLEMTVLPHGRGATRGGSTFDY